MFIIQDNIVEIPDLDSPIAMDVYGTAKSIGVHISDSGSIFSRQNEIGKNNYLEHIIDTSNEVQALMDVAYEKMMSDTPATSQADLEDYLSSSTDLIDIPTFVADYIDYILVYKEGTTRVDFENQFLYLKEQQENGVT